MKRNPTNNGNYGGHNTSDYTENMSVGEQHSTDCAMWYGRRKFASAVYSQPPKKSQRCHLVGLAYLVKSFYKRDGGSLGGHRDSFVALMTCPSSHVRIG